MTKLFFSLLLVVLLSTQASLAQNKQVDPEKRIKELGITLKEPPAPIANFVPAVTAGKLVFISGHGPVEANGQYLKGKVGRDLDVEQGKAAARLTAITLLGVLKSHVGDLSKVKRIVKVLGMVNATEDFDQHPQVINGFSDLMVEVFGENGRHARSAVGMGSLPMGIPVEIEMIVELK
ncbi:RidA family protein [Rhodocytophaga aerolata]|uniref:RidA family protein n=1 Tax=Rhodocytophaga aerolata TaxID=455078 RepID=A0ABT8RF98_9BACT|nr:RidA family protein [Rhodocytophaga aerolata]MDO1450779.1 RidA family protein [Rhodocytophaga aerolata]